MKALIISRYILIAIAAVTILAFLIGFSAQRVLSHKTVVGMPQELNNNSTNFFEAIEDVAVTDDTIYLLFESTGELKLFDLDGNYLQSFAYSLSNNGRAELHRIGETIYLEDRSHNIYEFRHRKFVQYYDQSKEVSATYIKELQAEFVPSGEKATTSTGIRYHISATSLFKNNDGVTEQVFGRPQWSILFHSLKYVGFWGIPAVVLSSVITDIIRHKK